MSDTEREVIAAEAKRCFGSNARVTLFGSRVDDNRRGGDIDLLVQGPWQRGEAFTRKLRFLVGVKSRLGDQRIDVLVAQPGDRRAIVAEAARQGVPV